MLNNFSDFAKNEDGAITVDWVVLTAAIVGFGVAVVGLISPKVADKTREFSVVMDHHSAAPPF
jgi:Flp pilus assembly pilin Flp